MKRYLCSLLQVSATLALWLLGASTLAHAKAQTTITNLQIPLETTLANPCTGELIAFSGDIHLLIRATSTPSGNFSTTVHQNFQNMAGIGADSGDTFHFQFSTTQVFTAAPGATTTLAQK